MKHFLIICAFVLITSGLKAQNKLDFDVFLKSTLTFENESTMLGSEWLEKTPTKKVIFFWATWCGPCIMEMEAVKEAIAAGKLDASNVYFISDETPQKIAAFVTKRGMEPVNIVRISATAQTLGIMSIPFSVAIDDKGKVSTTETGFYNKKHTLDFIENHSK